MKCETLTECEPRQGAIRTLGDWPSMQQCVGCVWLVPPEEVTGSVFAFGTMSPQSTEQQWSSDTPTHHISSVSRSFDLIQTFSFFLIPPPLVSHQAQATPPALSPPVHHLSCRTKVQESNSSHTLHSCWPMWWHARFCVYLVCQHCSSRQHWSIRTRWGPTGSDVVLTRWSHVHNANKINNLPC